MAGAGLALPTAGLVIGTDTIVIAALVGILTTLVASVAPALKASRVAPLAALRDVAVDRSATSTVRAIAGRRRSPPPARSPSSRRRRSRTAPSPAPGSAPSPCSSASSSSARSSPGRRPPCSAPAPAPTRGFTGRLARRNAMRNPRRIAVSASALMVGTAVVALFTTFGSSVKASIDDMVDDSFGGDLIVAQDDFSGAGIDPALTPAIGELPEVDGAVGVGAGHGDRSTAAPSTRRRPIRPRLAAVLDLDVTDGSLADVGPGEIAISTHYADDHGLGHRRRRCR